MNWTKYIAERYAPKKPTLFSNLMDSAKKAAKELNGKYKWETYTISMTRDSVFLCYTKNGGLFTILVPVTKILRTLTVTPHLETAVRKHMARELRRKKTQQ